MESRDLFCDEAVAGRLNIMRGEDVELFPLGLSAQLADSIIQRSLLAFSINWQAASGYPRGELDTLRCRKTERVPSSRKAPQRG